MTSFAGKVSSFGYTNLIKLTLYDHDLIVHVFLRLIPCQESRKSQGLYKSEYNKPNVEVAS